MTTPEGWKLTTLGALGRYINGRGFKKEEWGPKGRPIIRIQNLTGSSHEFNHFDGSADERHIVRSGDLLVSWAATLGAYFWKGPEAVLNQHIFKVESNIDPGFHKHLLDHMFDELMRNTHGSGMVHITRGAFDSIPVAVPPAAEQRRIVSILEDHLSRLEAADAYLNSAALRLRSMERSALDSHFGGCSVPLSELIDNISAGKSFGSANAPAKDGEWGIIKVSAMTWGVFDAGENKAVAADRVDPRFEIREGDLLMSRANTDEYVGASVLVGPVRSKLLLSDKSLRITPKPGVRSDWLWRALQAPSARRQIRSLATGTKASMRNISQESLRSVLLPAASDDEQHDAIASFSEIAATIDHVREQIRHARSKQAALRRSLLVDAFSGRLVSRSFNLSEHREMIPA